MTSNLRKRSNNKRIGDTTAPKSKILKVEKNEVEGVQLETSTSLRSKGKKEKVNVSKINNSKTETDKVKPSNQCMLNGTVPVDKNLVISSTTPTLIIESSTENNKTRSPIKHKINPYCDIRTLVDEAVTMKAENKKRKIPIPKMVRLTKPPYKSSNKQEYRIATNNIGEFRVFHNYNVPEGRLVQANIICTEVKEIMKISLAPLGYGPDTKVEAAETFVELSATSYKETKVTSTPNDDEMFFNDVLLGSGFLLYNNTSIFVISYKNSSSCTNYKNDYFENRETINPLLLDNDHQLKKDMETWTYDELLDLVSSIDTKSQDKLLDLSKTNKWYKNYKGKRKLVSYAADILKERYKSNSKMENTSTDPIEKIDALIWDTFKGKANIGIRQGGIYNSSAKEYTDYEWLKDLIIRCWVAAMIEAKEEGGPELFHALENLRPDQIQIVITHKDNKKRVLFLVHTDSLNCSDNAPLSTCKPTLINRLTEHIPVAHGKITNIVEGIRILENDHSTAFMKLLRRPFAEFQYFASTEIQWLNRTCPNLWKQLNVAKSNSAYVTDPTSNPSNPANIVPTINWITMEDMPNLRYTNITTMDELISILRNSKKSRLITVNEVGTGIVDTVSYAVGTDQKVETEVDTVGPVISTTND